MVPFVTNAGISMNADADYLRPSCSSAGIIPALGTEKCVVNPAKTFTETSQLSPRDVIAMQGIRPALIGCQYPIDSPRKMVGVASWIPGIRNSLGAYCGTSAKNAGLRTPCSRMRYRHSSGQFGALVGLGAQ